ncbi:L-rhamnose mutarotase [Christensenellaceae bacterium OttesenSCG-928-M15]|nr:L-rhamnose mutarotase [Christensenellaceae bacterium OttesenSCG-928-M15]
MMERFAWKARVLAGMQKEYVRRHDEIWPEMTAVLNEAGIHNYSIFLVGDELFGYYECESIEYASRVQAQSEVVDRWNEYMKDVMVMEFDETTGTAVLLKQVFYHG